MKRRDAQFALYDDLATAIVVVNNSGKVIYANSYAAFMIHLSPRRIRTQPAIEALFTIEGYSITDLIAQTQVSATAKSSQEVQLKSGDLIKDVIIKVIPATAADGSPIVALNIQDVSIEKALHHKYRLQMEELKSKIALGRILKLAGLGELAAVMAHDLRNPLAVIQGNLEILAKLYRDHEGILDRLSKMTFSCERIDRLIHQVTHFSRSDQEPQFFTVTELLENAIILMEGKMRRVDVKLQQEVAPHLPPLVCNGIQIEQLFMNLLSNACDAMKELPAGRRRELNIRLLHARNSVCIEIEDTGVGISASKLERIFDSTFTTKPDGHGTGLGLSIVKDIVAKHGGTIKVESEPGIGTKFSIALAGAAISVKAG